MSSCVLVIMYVLVFWYFIFLHMFSELYYGILYSLFCCSELSVSLQDVERDIEVHMCTQTIY